MLTLFPGEDGARERFEEERAGWRERASERPSVELELAAAIS